MTNKNIILLQTLQKDYNAMLYPEDGHIREREDSAVMGEERHSGRKSGIGEGKRSKIGVNDKYNMKERRNFLLKKREYDSVLFGDNSKPSPTAI